MAYDYGKGFTGIGTGASYGASFGPWGALAGGLIGSTAGFFGDKKPKQTSTFDPHQKQLYEQQAQALQGGGGPLADVYGQYNPELMKNYYEQAYARPAYQEFQENIVPTITGQFRGGNLQNSSYLGNALSRAGTNVQNNLNAQMSELLYRGQQSSLDRRANALDRILNLQTHVNERPQPSVFDSLLTSLSSGAGDILGDYLKNRNRMKTPITPNTANQTSAYPQTSGVQPTIGG
jgi:hypothetical protein